MLSITRWPKVQDRGEFECLVSDAQHIWSGKVQNLESVYFPGWVRCLTRGNFVPRRSLQNSTLSHRTKVTRNSSHLEQWPSLIGTESPLAPKNGFIRRFSLSLLQYHIRFNSPPHDEHRPEHIFDSHEIDSKKMNE